MSERSCSLSDKRRPAVGVAVIIRQSEGKVLLSKRLSSKMAGWWQAPGGSIEWRETFEQAAIREVKEECGLEVVEAKVLGVDTEYDAAEDWHWVVIFVEATWWRGSLKNPEPEKQGPWGWYAIDQLPEQTLKPLVKLLKAGTARLQPSES